MRKEGPPVGRGLKNSEEGRTASEGEEEEHRGRIKDL